MATLEYAVSNQEIATTKTAELVKNTIGFYTVKFTFTGSVWTGLSERWAVFDPDIGESYKTPLDGNGECSIPGEVMSANSLLIGVYGVTDGIEYPTIWTNRKWLKDGAYEDCPVSDYPEPSPVIETLQEEIDELTAGKVDKPENATEGNVAIFGSNSNISDSGISKDNLLIAPQLASNNIKTDSIPYTYRQTGGGIGVGNREYDSIVGGSIVWDQKAPILSEGSYSSNGITYTKNSDGSIIVNGTATANSFLNGYVVHGIIGHVCLVRGCPHGGSSATFYLRDGYTSQRIDTGNGVLVKKTSDNILAQINVLSGITLSNAVFKPQIYDLTQMFGTAVAEKLYEMGDDGLNLFNSWFPEAYYPYTATPSLESVSGLSSHQMKDGNGNVIAEYPLDSSLTLRGVAVIDDNNNIKFDGDTYAPDGTVTRKYGIVDLGTLTYSKSSIVTNGFVATAGMPSDFPIAPSTQAVPKWVNGKGYTVVSNASLESDSVDKAMGWRISGSNKGVIIKDSTYASYYTNNDMASFKSAMSGIYLVYEKTAPTTETAEPYDSLQICDPLGTEEYVTTGICPVGHVTQYPEDQVAKLDGLPSDFSRIIAPTEKAYKATRTYTVGRLLIVNNILYKVISAISSGATLTVGTNISETTLDEVIASL